MADLPALELVHTSRERFSVPMGGFRKAAQGIYEQGEQHFVKSGLGFSVDIHGHRITPLYHTWGNHIVPATEALDSVVNEYRDGEGIDPFNIGGDTGLWRLQFIRDHPEADPQLVDTFFAQKGHLAGFEVAMLAHNLGNMPESVLSGNTRPDGSFIQKEGAESRSADLADQLLEAHFAEYEALPIMKGFVRHLIMQTVDLGENPDPATVKSQPFWRLMQACDQVGSYYFSPVAHESLYGGLLNEFAARGETMPSTLSDILTFVDRRTGKLLYDRDEIREPVLAIWSANPRSIKPETFVRPAAVADPARSIDYASDIPHLARVGYFYDKLSSLDERERNALLRHDLGGLVADVVAWGELAGFVRGYDLDITQVNELFTSEALTAGR